MYSLLAPKLSGAHRLRYLSEILASVLLQNAGNEKGLSSLGSLLLATGTYGTERSRQCQLGTSDGIA